MQTLIAEQMQEEQSVFQEQTSRSRRSLSFVGSFFKWCCDVATQSEVADIVDNEKDITDHTNLLVDEVGLDHKDLVMTTDHFNNFTQGVQGLATRVHDSIRLLQSRIDSLQNTSGEALQGQLLTFSQEIMGDVYFNYFHDNLRDVRRSCENKRLPTALIARPTLKRDLIKMQETVRNHSLYLSIPVEECLHLYYTLPITSCNIFSNNIAISIRVPLSKFPTRPIIFRNVPVPLIWGEKLCRISQDDHILAKTSYETQIIHKGNENCNIRTFPLCKLPRIAANLDIGHECVSGILRGSDAVTLRKTCNFICQEKPNWPIITELLPNKFLITNIPDQVYILCPGKPDYLLPMNKSGTLEIILPCPCSIQQILPSSRRIILVHTIKPCDSKDQNSSSVTHLLPLTWSTLHSISILPLEENIRYKFDNAHGIIDEDWNVTTTTYHVHNLIKEDLLTHIKLKHEMSDVISNQQLLIYILLAWGAIMTLLVLISLYFIHILFIKMPPRVPPRDIN